MVWKGHIHGYIPRVSLVVKKIDFRNQLARNHKIKLLKAIISLNKVSLIITIWLITDTCFNICIELKLNWNARVPIILGEQSCYVCIIMLLDHRENFRWVMWTVIPIAHSFFMIPESCGRGEHYIALFFCMDSF